MFQGRPFSLELAAHWAEIRGAKDLAPFQCSRVYYSFSSTNQTRSKAGKRYREDMEKLTQYVRENKEFIPVIIAAKDGAYKFELLETILRDVSNLSKVEKGTIQRVLDTKQVVIRPSKRQRTQ